MNFFLPFRNVRTRLTLWYALTLACVLLIYSVGIYEFLKMDLLGSLDRLLREDIEAVSESLLDLPLKNGKALIEKYEDRPNRDVRERWLLEIWTISPQRVLSIPQTLLSTLPPPNKEECRRRGIEGRTIEDSHGLKLRIKCETLEIGDHPLLIRVSRSAHRVFEELKSLFLLMLFSIPISIFISGVGGYLLARRVLFPIQQMTHQAQFITAEGLSKRLEVNNPEDELGKLATTFNEVFFRLERSFEQMRRFSSDASHELRTPLTAIRAMAEVALRFKQHKLNNTHSDTLSSILEETDRLQNLIDNLLMLSRADAGNLKCNRKLENFANLVKEVIHYLFVLGEEKTLSIHSELDSDLNITCDRNILRLAIVNLLDNAIKFSPAGAEIQVRLFSGHSEIFLEIQDAGPGIAIEHQSKVFDRFYRIDAARARHQKGGTGLGLSIAKWAIEIHHGRLELESTVGKGSIFRIILKSP